jgi:hypothetical protein
VKQENSPIEIPQLLNYDDLVIKTKKTRRYLEMQVRDGKLRKLTLSAKSVRFLPQDVMAWLERQPSCPATSQEEAK